jgi:hypothetical protein
MKHLEAAAEDLVKVSFVALAIFSPILLVKWVPALLDNWIQVLQSLRDLKLVHTGSLIAEAMVRKAGIVAVTFFGAVAGYKSLAVFTLEPNRFAEK